MVLPWENDGVAAIGASHARWAVLHGMAVLCGPIMSPEVVAATGWSTKLASMEMQWATEAGWLRREQNPEWDQWVPQHANGAKPKWRYWSAGPVERQKPDPTRRGRAPGPRGPKGRKIVA